MKCSSVSCRRTTKLCDRPAATVERKKIYEKIQDSERKAEGRFAAARG